MEYQAPRVLLRVAAFGVDSRLGITLFVGTAVMMDLRLVGVTFRSVPVSEFTGRMLPWTRGGAVVMVVTGLLIF